MPENDQTPNCCTTVAANSVDFRAVDDITALARSLFGSEAATAIAFCGIEAYLNDEELEFRTFVRAFRRSQN